MQLFVGTPNLNSRVQQFEDAVSSKLPMLAGDKKTEIIEAYRNFFEIRMGTRSNVYELSRGHAVR